MLSEWAAEQESWRDGTSPSRSVRGWVRAQGCVWSSPVAPWCDFTCHFDQLLTILPSRSHFALSVGQLASRNLVPASYPSVLRENSTLYTGLHLNFPRGTLQGTFHFFKRNRTEMERLHVFFEIGRPRAWGGVAPFCILYLEENLLLLTRLQTCR